jgi:hypothetical protein
MESTHGSGKHMESTHGNGSLLGAGQLVTCRLDETPPAPQLRPAPSHGSSLPIVRTRWAR